MAYISFKMATTLLGLTMAKWTDARMQTGKVTGVKTHPWHTEGLERQLYRKNWLQLL